MKARRHAAIAALFLLGGCAAALQPRETSLLQQNRFVELRQVMEARVVDPGKATTYDLFYLCYAYARVRQYDRLFPCLDFLQARIDLGDTKVYWFDFSAAAVLMRAQAAIEFGDFARARTLAERAVALTRSEQAYIQMRILALTAFGLAQALGGAAEPARATAGELAALKPDIVTASDQHIGIARISMALGDHPRALAALAEDDKSAGFRALVDVMSGAGLAGESIFFYWELPKSYIRSKANLETGDIAAAKSGYDAMLARPGTAQSADLYWLILFDRGTIAEREDDAAGAIDFYRRAIKDIERQRASIPLEAAKIGFVGDKQQVYRRLISLLIAQGRSEEAFDYVERAKSRALVDLLAARQNFAPKERSAVEIAALMDELDTQQKTMLRGEPVAADAPPERAGVPDATERLRRAAPELASLVAVTSIPVGEIVDRLMPDEALIEYYGDDGGLFAFVLDRNGLRVHRLDGRGLADAVRRFRADIREALPEAAADARALHARLVAPLGPLPARLAVVPHGILHYLPFAALHDGRSYLLERVRLRMLPAASVVRYLGRPRRHDLPPLLVLGNPTLDLPGAEAEANAIRGLWPDSRVLLRGQATKAAFRRFGAEFRYLHFATHGRFDAARPLQSGLSLAAEGGEPGLLTVDELYELRLTADFAMLSACDTALGTIANGDDVVGLTRGFLYAGAQSIIATLWPVADEQTAFLATEFYRGLRTNGKADALRQAQLATLKRFPHPVFWAAFQLTGDGG